MGGGVSRELTSGEKEDVARAMQERYRELTTLGSGDENISGGGDVDICDSNAVYSASVRGGGQGNKAKTATASDVELFKALSSVYEDKVGRKPKTTTTNSNSNSNSNDKNEKYIDGELFDESVEALSPSKMLEKFKDDNLNDDDEDYNVIKYEGTDEFRSSSPNNFSSVVTKKRPSFRDPNRRPSFDIDTDFQESSGTICAKSSIDFLEEAERVAHENSAKINSFIESIKDIDQLMPTSDFRARRLTFGTTTEIKPDKSEPAGISRRDSKMLSRKRTSIFSSSEIGVKQEKKPPFDDTVFGTYSCHGIEPDPVSETGTHEKINQDRGCVVYPFNNKPKESFFMVLDGHGEQGDKVSEFIMRQIVIHLEKHPLLVLDPASALKESYIKSNTALMSTQINYMASGCTCVGVYMIDQHFYVANVGDSRAVMATKKDKELDENGNVKIKAKDLSKDHKPDDPIEMARILESGGFVCPSPEPGITGRVYLDAKFTQIGLAMSRSIGDYCVKKVGVIPEPDVFEYDLHPDDQFIIIASDGVWEFISSQEAVDIVVDSLEYGALVACQELIETAAHRWQEIEGDYRDDITAIIFRLPLNAKADMQDAAGNRGRSATSAF